MNPDIAGRLDPASVGVLRKLGVTAAAMGSGAWLVGGLVRDLFLGVNAVDLDIAVEGDGPAFARRAAGELNADIVEYGAFMTAMLTLPDGTRLDVATARSEKYGKPGALPDVRPSTIEQDMFRRDVSINAMAVALAPDRFGGLYDPFGGGRDIAAKAVRILHGRSFLDDPTRILRAVRFECRFGFTLEAGTLASLREALAAGAFGTISADRLREEFLLVFSEPAPARALERLAALGVLGSALPGVAVFPRMAERLELAENLVTLAERGGTWDPAMLGVLLMLCDAPASLVEATAGKLNLSARARAAIAGATGLSETARRAAAAESAAEIDDVLRGKPFETVLAAMVLTDDVEARRRILEWKQQSGAAEEGLDGNDLMEMGYGKGPLIGRILEALRRARLEGRVNGTAEEREFVRRSFPLFGGPDGSV